MNFRHRTYLTLACCLIAADACTTSSDSLTETASIQPPAPAATTTAPAAPAPVVPATPLPGPPASAAGSTPNTPAPTAPTATMPPTAGAPAAAPAIPAANADAFNPYKDFKSDFYATDAAWACKPGSASNPCAEGLEATEVLPDGTIKPVDAPMPGMRPIDCLYFYPTVNRAGDQASRDFSNSSAIVNVVLSQGARFSEVCNVYAPFYRLAGLSGGDGDLAYGDVAEAFKYYVANLSEGRDFVLLGHSQGSNHGLRLLKEEIDTQPELRKRMVSAIMLGFPVQLPEGQATGGTFKTLPICQSDAQRGCLINFMSFSAQMPPTSSNGNGGFGAIEVCTNPAALGGGPGLFQGTYFRAQGSPVAAMVKTPWVLYRDFFRGECKRSGGTAYLEISRAQQAGDQRMFGMLSEIPGIGLHIMDFVFPQGDLVALIAKQAALKP